MASYQTRGRAPLLDGTTQAALERRSKELLGFLLIGAGVAAALMLISYSPDDPNWMLATDAPVQNWLGRFGASLAHPLIMIVGLGAWVVPVACAVWGFRFSAHRGEERLLSRIIFLPIAVAMAAIYAATLTPGPDWGQSFGLGGLFGDTVLGLLLTVLPFAPSLGVRALSLLLGLGMLAILAFVLGATAPELRALRRFLLQGLALAYDRALRLGGRGGAAGLAAARDLGGRVAVAVAARRDRLAEARAARLAAVATAGDPGALPASAPRGPAVIRPQDAAVPPQQGGGGRVAAPMAESPAPQAAMRPAMPPPLTALRSGAVPAAAATGTAPPRLMPPEPPLARVQREAPATGAPAAPVRPGQIPGALRAMPPAASPFAAVAPVAPAAPVAPLAADPVRRGGLLARVPGLLRRGRGGADLRREPPLTVSAGAAAAPAAVDERVRSRIADAIRARERSGLPTGPGRVEPALCRPRGPRPLILDTAPRQPGAGLAGAAAMPSGPAMPPQVRAPALQQPAAPPTAAPPAAAPPAAATPAAAPLPSWTFRPDRLPPEPPLRRPAAPAAPLPVDAAAPAPLPEEVVADLPLRDEGAPRRLVPEAEPRRVVQNAPRKPIAPSSRARAEAQPPLPLEERFADYEFPPLALLTDPATVKRHHLSDEALEENARMLESVLDDYGVRGEIVSVRPGPVVTLYELEPAPGLKASRVIGLADDIARSMSALSARVSTVPGRSVIGIELPNANREKVLLREILSSRDFGDSQMRLPLALGKDIAGEPVVANLAKMPHLLIAGTTGSGKSVAINTMILSLLYKLTPEECRLIMIDPKMLELSVYDGIPHLLSPVVTDPKKAVVALKWVVGEMEERYRKMSKMGVRNIEGYNGRVRDALARGETFSRTVQTGFDDETGDPIFETEEFQPEILPYIVVIVDEMADLMMVAGKEIEACIQRLAQMARASGIHLIMATQRPSVDVITGTIKANFPTRISFQVTSKIDSRTILGEQGAEQLLGMGDMLFMAGGGRITRIHGPFCSDEEVEEVVSFLKSYGPPAYKSGVTEGPDEDRESDIDAVLGLSAGSEAEDALYDMAVQIVAKDRKCSTSYIQRKLAIGYNKAARLVEQMETNGVVSPANAVGKREILVPEVH